MRRSLVLICSLFLLAAGLPVAHAADSTVVVKSERNPETGYFPGTATFRSASGCEIGPVSQTLRPYIAVEADNPAPPTGLGARSWGYQFQHGLDAVGIGVDVPNAAGLDTFGMQVYGAGAASGRAVVFAFPEGTAEGFVWLGFAETVGGGDTWTYVDASDLTYTWDEYELATWTPTSATGMSGTIAQYDAAHGSELGYTALLGFGCSASNGTKYFFDGFKYGPSGGVVTVDFEAYATTVSIAATKSTIVAGNATGITGVPSAKYIPYTPVDLEVKPFGSGEFTKLVTVNAPEEASYQLAKTVRPLRQATYRWHYLGTEIDDASYSSEIVVNVKTGLTAKVADATIKRGNNIVVSGKTKPGKPGMTVSLWRKTSTGASLLATTKVKSDGSYKISHQAGRTGTWKVYTTIPAGSGNLAGKSTVRSVSVS